MVDTLAGAMLRVFVRLNEIERAFGELRTRFGRLEEDPAPATRPSQASDVNRRTTQDGRPDRRGSNASSRFALRQARSATAAASSNPVAADCAPAGLMDRG